MNNLFILAFLCIGAALASESEEPKSFLPDADKKACCNHPPPSCPASQPNCYREGIFCCSDGNWHISNGAGQSSTCEMQMLTPSKQCQRRDIGSICKSGGVETGSHFQRDCPPGLTCKPVPDQAKIGVEVDWTCQPSCDGEDCAGECEGWVWPPNDTVKCNSEEDCKTGQECGGCQPGYCACDPETGEAGLCTGDCNQICKYKEPECSSTADCDEGWCRSSDDETSECVPYVELGGRCEGRPTLPSEYEMCAPNVTCMDLSGGQTADVSGECSECKQEDFNTCTEDGGTFNLQDCSCISNPVVLVKKPASVGQNCEPITGCEAGLVCVVGKTAWNKPHTCNPAGKLGKQLWYVKTARIALTSALQVIAAAVEDKKDPKLISEAAVLLDEAERLLGWVTIKWESLVEQKKRYRPSQKKRYRLSFKLQEEGRKLKKLVTKFSPLLEPTGY